MLAQLSSSARRAFTIVELLVAIAVTAVLVTLMVTITVNVLSAWNRSSGNLSAGNQARLVLDQLSQDLQGAIIRRDSNTWLVATIQRDQITNGGDSGFPAGQWTESSGELKPTAALGSLRIDPTAAEADENPNFPLGIENYRFGQAGVWLRFFTTPPDNRDAGQATQDIKYSSAPRAVAYQMIRRKVGGAAADEAPRVYSLYRSEVRPADKDDPANSTFGAGYDLLMDPSGVSYNVGDGGANLVGNVRQPPAQFLIANDVIDFGVKLYGKDLSGAEVELFPVRRNASGAGTASTTLPISFAVSSRTTAIPGGLVATVGTPEYGYPTAADVMLRILTPEGVRLIQAIESGTLDADWWTTAIQNSQVFTRRIEIKSKGL